MSRFNAYFANGFRACRLLGYAHDNFRNRDVKVWMMPGDFENVGVTDGVDCWVAPATINPFSINVVRILEDIRAGKTVEVQGYAPGTEPKTRRRALLVEDGGSTSPSTRKRLLVDPGEPQTQPRARRSLIIND